MAVEEAAIYVSRALSYLFLAGGASRCGLPRVGPCVYGIDVEENVDN